jgi:hypothetical protein
LADSVRKIAPIYAELQSLASRFCAPYAQRFDMTEILLVLLRHKFLRPLRAPVLPQHGQRGKHSMMAAMSIRRMVAIEFGMCRSGRNGGAAGSVTLGYGKLREERGGTRS